MKKFQRWIEQQDKIVDWGDITPTDQMKMAWKAAVKETESENLKLKVALADLLAALPRRVACDCFHHEKQDQHDSIVTCKPTLRYHTAVSHARSLFRSLQ